VLADAHQRAGLCRLSPISQPNTRQWGAISCREGKDGESEAEVGLEIEMKKTMREKGRKEKRKRKRMKIKEIVGSIARMFVLLLSC
jgi:hypothetical protein